MAAFDELEWPEGTIALVLEKYGWEIPSQRSGWVTIKCGAHKDSNASCRINYSLNAVKCMGCSFGGDAIKVCKFYEGEGKPFVHYLRIVEEIAGVSGGSTSSGYSPRSAVPAVKRDHRGNSTFISPRLRQGR